MFKCFKCGKITKPGEKATKVVLETREVEYVNKRTNRRGEEITKITNGTEIAREEIVCEKCGKECDINEKDI